MFCIMTPLEVLIFSKSCNNLGYKPLKLEKQKQNKTPQSWDAKAWSGWMLGDERAQECEVLNFLYQMLYIIIN